MDDCGGAFTMGLIGGGIFQAIKGFRNAPSVSCYILSIQLFLTVNLSYFIQGWLMHKLLGKNQKPMCF